jgi:hypothetical protein
MHPLARRRCVVRNQWNGASIELESGEYAVLSACEGCRTLAEHEARAAQQLSAPPAHRPAIRELLERCARQGLLTTLADLTARFGAASEATAEPIAGVSIPTSDRPQFVQRLLAGAAKLQRRTGNAYRWHVFDDSRSAENRRANRDAIASCPDLEVEYHDLSASDSLEARLAAEFPALREEIHSLLAEQPEAMTNGRAMNHLLLWFAGHRFLSIDDDALLDPRQPPIARRGVDVGVAAKSAFWYERIDEAYAACPELALDPLAEHARWLGLPLAQAWARARGEPGGLRIDGLPGPAEAYFETRARVLFTWNHVLGDPGWARFSGELLVIDSETRSWLAAHPGSARSAFENQVQWRGFTSLRLSPQESLITTTLSGLDDRVLLAPAFRIDGDADTLIGEAVRCVHPAAWVVSLPFALPHLRNAGRRYPTPADAVAFNANRALIEYARARFGSIRGDGPEERLLALGGAFSDLAAASDARLRSVIEEQAADVAGRLAFQVNEQLHDPATPPSWKDVLRPWLASSLLRLDRASLAARSGDPGVLRGRAREFGRALLAWPRLWAWCREHPQ